MNRTKLDERRIQRVIEMDPEKLGFIQKILWLVIVLITWRLRQIEKQLEEEE